MKNDIFGMLNALILISSAVAAFIFLSDGMNSIATKEYHDDHVEKTYSELTKTLQVVELNTLPPRIRPLVQSKQEACEEGREFSPEADQVLMELLARYEELRGVAWRTGKCVEGVWQ